MAEKIEIQGERQEEMYEGDEVRLCGCVCMCVCVCGNLVRTFNALIWVANSYK